MISFISRFRSFAFVVPRFNFAWGFVEGEGNSVVGEYDTKYVTFELLLHAAFEANKHWGDMLQPARSNIISYPIISYQLAKISFDEILDPTDYSTSSNCSISN